jgi:hypothetical protein
MVMAIARRNFGDINAMIQGNQGPLGNEIIAWGIGDHGTTDHGTTDYRPYEQGAP